MADSKEILICPACGNKMIKIPTSSGVNVDICVNGCGGIWFDNRELEKFDDKNEDASDIFKVLEGRVFSKVDNTIQRKCPVCSAKMISHLSSPTGKVMIDDCYTCGGKFFDYDELRRIREEINEPENWAEEVTNSLYKKNGYVPYKGNKAAIKSFLIGIYKNMA